MSIWLVCGHISTPAASFNTNGRPRSDFEHGRVKSIQFFRVADDALEMYTNRFSPSAFRIASVDDCSVGEAGEMFDQYEYNYVLCSVKYPTNLVSLT